jgi:hypothetical protein
MAANVVKSVDGFGNAPDDDDALPCDVAREVVTRCGNGIGASGADPTVKVEGVDLLPKNFRVRVVARG